MVDLEGGGQRSNQATVDGSTASSGPPSSMVDVVVFHRCIAGIFTPKRKYVKENSFSINWHCFSFLRNCDSEIKFCCPVIIVPVALECYTIYTDASY